VPGSNGNAITRTLFGNRNDSGRKRELVVLIKPTIIKNSDDWQRSTERALAAFEPPPQRTVVVNAPAVTAAAPKPAAAEAPPAAKETAAAPVAAAAPPVVLAAALPLPTPKPDIVSSPMLNVR
jgi:MSHA biogenesis protein MshL